MVYLIADANGLRSDADLRPGQTLTIPNLISNVHNSAGTFKPYDPSELLGDTSPTLPTPNPPKPKKHGNKCGGMATVITIAVAVAVAYYTQRWDLVTDIVGKGSALAAGIGAAAGSIASQVVAMKLGVQDGFSWKAVAVAAVSGGLTKGVDFGQEGLNAVAAAARNVISQGVGIFINPGTPFSWKTVAVAAISGPINQSIVGDPQAANEFTLGNLASSFGREFIATSVETVVSMAVYDKGQFNFANVAADAFGNALGNSIVAGMRRSEQDAQRERELSYDMADDAFFDEKGNEAILERMARDDAAFARAYKNSTVPGMGSAGGFFPDSQFGGLRDYESEYRGTSIGYDPNVEAAKFNAELDGMRARSAAAPASSGNFDLGFGLGITRPMDGANATASLAAADLAHRREQMTHYQSYSSADDNIPRFQNFAMSLLLGTDVTARDYFDEIPGGGGYEPIGLGETGFPLDAVAGFAALGIKRIGGVVANSSLVADEVAALSRIKANAAASLNLNQRINAKAIQVDSGYNADIWKTGRLNEGDVIYSLSPNPNPKFFTSLETLQSSKFDSSAVSRALQIEEHPLRGYRVDVAGYRVKQSFDLPYGTTRANPQFGPGGGDQYLIYDYKKYLEPITTIDMKW